MSIRTFASSVEEVRYFQRRGGPTIDGSTPILDNLEPKEETNMFAIQLKNGKLLSEDELSEVSVEYAQNARWFPYYLQATEYATKKGCHVLGCKQVMKDMSDHINSLTAQLEKININVDGPRKYTGDKGDPEIPYD